MLRLAPLASLLLTACAAEPPPAKPEPRFEPLAFFEGRTRGEGVIDTLFGDDKQLRVTSVGRRDEDSILLVQWIVEGDKPPRVRQWRLRRIAPGRYSGKLTDAVGPVIALAEGSRLTVRYQTPSGHSIEQFLTLQPDRRTVANLLIVRQFGIAVAKVRETIRKSDQALARERSPCS